MRIAFGQRLLAGGAVAALALAAAVPTVARGGDTGRISDYKIQPLDTIHVNVFGETNLCVDCKVRADGRISYPLLREVPVVGLTTVQAQDVLRQKLLDWLVDPDVIVSVTKYGERTVLVLGEVTKQGAIPLPEEQKWDIVEAIAEAGGFTKLAKRKGIQFTRDGKTRVYDYDKLVKEKDPAKKLWLLPGDVINVPQVLW